MSVRYEMPFLQHTLVFHIVKTAKGFFYIHLDIVNILNLTLIAANAVNSFR